MDDPEAHVAQSRQVGRLAAAVGGNVAETVRKLGRLVRVGERQSAGHRVDRRHATNQLGVEQREKLGHLPTTAAAEDVDLSFGGLANVLVNAAGQLGQTRK